MKKAASMVGAPSLLASQTIVPLFTSYEAATITGDMVDSALDKTDLGTVEKSTISGASSGVAGAATFSGTSAAVVKTGQLAKAGIQAIRGAQTIGEVAEGTELVPLLTTAGEATEVAEVAAGAFEAAEVATAAVEIGEAALITAEVAEAAIITTEAVGIGAAAASGAAAGSLLAPETFGLSILVGAGVGALGGLISGMWSHSADEERRKEAEILET